MSKERSINLILRGLFLKFFPLLMMGLIGNFANDALIEKYIGFSAILFLLILGLFIKGYIDFVKGCLGYSQCKGYPKIVGWLSLFSILGLGLLLIIPINKSKINSHYLEEGNQINPFEYFNIPELILLFVLGLQIVFFIFLLILIISIFNPSLFQLLENKIFLHLFMIVICFYFFFVLLRISQKSKITINNILGFTSKPSIKYIVLIALSFYIYSLYFNSLILYGLSYFLPVYVETFINQTYFTNLPELILAFLYIVVVAPLFEEFFFRGIILQKWVLKWGLKWGVFLSSLLFAIVHVRFDIISLTLIGVFLSFLYFRSSNLLEPILCHALYNAIILVREAISFYGKPEIERGKSILITEFQDSIFPFLGQYILITVIFSILLGYLCYKLTPKETDDIPYLKNTQNHVS